jgi:hypothetical protein
MRRRSWLTSKWTILGAVALGALAVVVWLEWTPILAWYYLRGLARAGEGEREVWVQRVARLDAAALPGLLDCLRRDEPRVCANARAALSYLIHRWGRQDPRTAALAGRLAEAFATRSLPGRRATLDLQGDLLLSAPDQGPPPAPLVRAAGRILDEAVRSPNKELNLQALVLADLLVDAAPPPDLLAAIHDLARAALTAADAAQRARAIHLARSRALSDKPDLLELILPLLRDPEARVRREALQALALRRYPQSDQYLINDDDLVAWLHDPDREVQRWCEKALRARNLSDLEIQLARLITDQRPKERLKVLVYLHRTRYETPGAWIGRLCDDPEPAVKIAAIRAAAEHPAAGLVERVKDLAQSDRSPTVRQVAEAYLQMMEHRR